jgi:hypothetical protein
VVGGFSSKAISVLCQHDRDPSGGHEVPDPVHARPPQGRPALAGVGDLLEDLVTLSGCVVPERFELLSQGVAAPGLLVSGDAGVEDSSLRVLAIRTAHSLVSLHEHSGFNTQRLG